MFGPGEERLKRWDQIISTHLNRMDPNVRYIKFNSKVMMGLCICLYGRKEIVGLVTNIQASKVKTGFQGAGENKGSVVLGFNVGQTSICLMNCHLAHGKSNYKKRFEEIKTIYSSYLGETHQEKYVAAHDIKFMFGDLNFRINIGTPDCCFIARQRNFPELLKHDQLWSLYGQFNFLPQLEESPVSFAPTYKFVKNTCFYDLDKRPPAWCDRILWGTSSMIKCLGYTSVEQVCYSDHKPIYGVYTVNIKRLATIPGTPSPVANKHVSRVAEPEEEVKSPDLARTAEFMAALEQPSIPDGIVPKVDHRPPPPLPAIKKVADMIGITGTYCLITVDRHGPEVGRRQKAAPAEANNSAGE